MSSSFCVNCLHLSVLLSSFCIVSWSFVHSNSIAFVLSFFLTVMASTPAPLAGTLPAAAYAFRMPGQPTSTTAEALQAFAYFTAVQEFQSETHADLTAQHALLEANGAHLDAHQLTSGPTVMPSSGMPGRVKLSRRISMPFLLQSSRQPRASPQQATLVPMKMHANAPNETPATVAASPTSGYFMILASPHAVILGKFFLLQGDKAVADYLVMKKKNCDAFLVLQRRSTSTGMLISSCLLHFLTSISRCCRSKPLATSYFSSARITCIKSPTREGVNQLGHDCPPKKQNTLSLPKYTVKYSVDLEVNTWHFHCPKHIVKNSGKKHNSSNKNNNNKTHLSAPSYNIFLRPIPI